MWRFREVTYFSEQWSRGVSFHGSRGPPLLKLYRYFKGRKVNCLTSFLERPSNVSVCKQFTCPQDRSSTSRSSETFYPWVFQRSRISYPGTLFSRFSSSTGECFRKETDDDTVLQNAPGGTALKKEYSPSMKLKILKFKKVHILDVWCLFKLMYKNLWDLFRKRLLYYVLFFLELKRHIKVVSSLYIF